MKEPVAPKVGRPRKDVKISLSIRIRKDVNARFRRFVGPDRILNEVVEAALVQAMSGKGLRLTDGGRV